MVAQMIKLHGGSRAGKRWEGSSMRPRMAWRARLTRTVDLRRGISSTSHFLSFAAVLGAPIYNRRRNNCSEGRSLFLSFDRYVVR